MRGVLILIVLCFGFCMPSIAGMFDAPVNKVESSGLIVGTTGNVISPVIDEIDPPVVGPVDLVTNIPAKGTAPDDWLFWIVGVVAVILYEIVFRIFPTTRDWSVLSLLYKICNLLAPNRVKGGGTFKVKKTR